MKGVSVIVSCHNSSDRLPPTLKHLGSQKTNTEIAWEIIVIDNASSDNTQRCARKILSQYNIPFKIIEEPQLGLSYARRRGIMESNYDFIIFCDDDNWLNSEYVQRVYYLLDKYSDIGVLGGNGTARRLHGSR